ncbi:hypothetical protein ACQPZF_33130 [Actinosynnema sp. CS-041913]|uniref:hypothetical protein n=1 Tax=Actinosynnema sp. CS-041913 TaxID=3239917 RepID=UPI003D8D72E9
MHTTNRATISLDALANLFPHRVTTAAELLSLGLSNEELTSRCRPGAPWQHVLPGVLLLSRKPPNRRQLMQAALRYAGPDAQLTGLDALQLHGMRALPVSGPIQVLSTRPVDPTPLLRVARSRTLPPPVLRKGFLTAPLARAAVDAAKSVLGDQEAVRAVLTEAVRRGGVGVADLAKGLSREADPTRRILRDLSDGIRTVPQAWAKALLADLPLPPPRWNVEVRTADGTPVGTADAWWEELALAWQFTANPDTLLTAAGAVVLRTPPQELRGAGRKAARSLLHATTQAQNRSRPALTGHTRP